MGVAQEEEYFITSELVGDPTVQPFDLASYEGAITSNGSREVLGRDVNGYLKLAVDWDRKLEFKEPCNAPLRHLLVRITEKSSLTHEQIAAAFDSLIESGRYAMLKARVSVRSKVKPETLLAYYNLDIELGGMIRVAYHSNNFGPNTLRALREIVGDAREDATNLQWLDGPPKIGGYGYIVPTPDSDLCTTAVKVSSQTGRRVEVGRRLVRDFLCGGCCVEIENGSGDSFVPTTIEDAFPRDTQPQASIEDWASHHPGRTTLWKEKSGSGRGTSGWVRINNAVLAGSTDPRNVRLPRMDAEGMVVDWNGATVLRPLRPARELAHELAHAWYACRGELRSGLKAAVDYSADPPRDPVAHRNDYDSVGEFRKALSDAENMWHDKSARARGRLKTINAAGTEDDVPWEAAWEAFGDRGEYDVITNWENPIGIELGDDFARFSH